MGTRSLPSPPVSTGQKSLPVYLRERYGFLLDQGFSLVEAGESNKAANIADTFRGSLRSPFFGVFGSEVERGGIHSPPSERRLRSPATVVPATFIRERGSINTRTDRDMRRHITGRTIREELLALDKIPHGRQADTANAHDGGLCGPQQPRRSLRNGRPNNYAKTILWLCDLARNERVLRAFLGGVPA
jgi:hypothetical protein